MAPVVLLLLPTQWYVMNEERHGKCLRQVNYIHGHLWHRYSVMDIFFIVQFFSDWQNEKGQLAIFWKAFYLRQCDSLYVNTKITAPEFNLGFSRNLCLSEYCFIDYCSYFSALWRLYCLCLFWLYCLCLFWLYCLCLFWLYCLFLFWPLLLSSNLSYRNCEIKTSSNESLSSYHTLHMILLYFGLKERHMTVWLDYPLIFSLVARIHDNEVRLSIPYCRNSHGHFFNWNTLFF